MENVKKIYLFDRYGLEVTYSGVTKTIVNYFLETLKEEIISLSQEYETLKIEVK